MLVDVQRGSAVVGGMPVRRGVLVPVDMPDTVLVAMVVRVRRIVGVRMFVVLAQLAPTGVGDPQAEPKERERGHDADEMRVTHGQRCADGPQDDPEQKRRGDVPEPGYRGSARDSSKIVEDRNELRRNLNR